MFRVLGTQNKTRSPYTHTALSDLISLMRSCAILPSLTTVLRFSTSAAYRVSPVITGCPGCIRTPMGAYNADAIVRTWPSMVLTARTAAPLLCFSKKRRPFQDCGLLSSFPHLVGQFLGRVILVCLNHNLVVYQPMDEVDHMVDRPLCHSCSAMPQP